MEFVNLISTPLNISLYDTFGNFVDAEVHESRCCRIQYTWNERSLSVIFDHTFESIFQLTSRVVLLISTLQLLKRRGEKVTANEVSL